MADEVLKTAYMHKWQMFYTLVSANSSVNICSRRWGKSYPLPSVSTRT